MFNMLNTSVLWVCLFCIELMVFMQGAPGKCSLVPRRPLLGLEKMRAPESNSQDAFSFWFVTQVERNPSFSLLLLCQRSAFSGHGPSQRRSLETGLCWLLEIIKLFPSWASVFQIFLKHFLSGFKCLPCLWQFPPYIPSGSESAIPFSIVKCGGYWRTSKYCSLSMLLFLLQILKVFLVFD